MVICAGKEWDRGMGPGHMCSHWAPRAPLWPRHPHPPVPTSALLPPSPYPITPQVGFPRRDPDRLKVALENTYHVIWVRSTRQSRLAKNGQMIGFARATSDGVLSATVWDVAVNPAWQRSGLGRALMERLTKKLVGWGGGEG